MDKRKVGKYIAQGRKAQHLTQEQLAQMLNVSNKSVSKWENGYCLPDSSLFEPLCNILNLTPNALFSHEPCAFAESHSPSDRILLDILKPRLYAMSDRSVSYSDFSQGLSMLADFSHQLQQFPTKDAAVEHWMQETGASREECSAAYDFYMRLFTKEGI